MTEYMQIVFMAIFQGIAEFLPISSSGHLELMGAMFGIAEDNRFTLSVVLHAGTLLSMLIFYCKDIVALFLEKKYRVMGAVIVGSIPAGIGGIALKMSGVDAVFHSLWLVGGCFLVTGVLLCLLRKMQMQEKKYVPLAELSWGAVWLIGIFQMIAILPGISRSGSTIFAGEKSRLAPEENARFSFFLGMAAIGGAAMLEFLSLLKKTEDISQGLSCGNYLTGFFAAAVSGYLALTLLLRLLKSKKLGYFGIYMFLAGALTIIYKIWN